MISVLGFSQRDPRWTLKKVGFSNLLFKDYGCTVTSLTALIDHICGLELTPAEVNDKLKAVKAFVGPLVYWSRVPLAFPELKWVFRDYNYNNIKVSYYVYLKKIPVMVEVNAGKYGSIKHWVLFLGDRMMLDPIDGKIKSTNTYPLTGSAIYDR